MTSKHTLRITCYHDAQAVCTCGGWSFTTIGPITQDVQVRIEEEFQRHLLASATRRDILGASATPAHHANVLP